MWSKNGSNGNYALKIVFNFVKTETSTKSKHSKIEVQPREEKDEKLFIGKFLFRFSTN